MKFYRVSQVVYRKNVILLSETRTFM